MPIWQPDLGKQKDEYGGALLSSWKGSSPYSIIYLLDPPQNILNRQQYQRAQQNLAKIYGRIPTDEPFVVGVQRDFWQETAKYIKDDPPHKLTEAYLEQGGQGLAFALTQNDKLPPVVCLEDERSFKEYQSVKAAAFKFMETASLFIRSLAKVFRKAQAQYYSAPLADFTQLIRKFRVEETINLLQYVEGVSKTAQTLGMAFPLDLYRVLVFIERLRAKEERVTGEDKELSWAIYTASQPARLTPRTTWELYRFYLTHESVDLSETEVAAQVAQIDSYLAQKILPEPTPEMREKVSRLARERTSKGLRLVVPGEGKGDLLNETGEQVSTPMEMAVLLGIDLTEFPLLAEYIQYQGLLRKLTDNTIYDYTNPLQRKLKKLESEIPRRLAQTDMEKTLVYLEPQISFLEHLTIFRLSHEENLRKTITDVNIVEICQALAQTNVKMPLGWKMMAQTLQNNFKGVQHFFDLTLSRGKDMGNTLREVMIERQVTKGVLYCDGYFSENLARWLQGAYISYAFIIPSWQSPAPSSS